MKPLLKILTVTLSLIACAACVMATEPSRSLHQSGGSVVSKSSTRSRATSDATRAMAPTFGNPSAWLTDVQSLMVANYEAGIARQERADAEAAAAEEARRAQIAALTVASAAVERSQPQPEPPNSGSGAAPAPLIGGIHAQPFLICVRRHESDRSDVNGNGLYDGGYAAKNPGSSAAGAYQFLTSTWNSVVNAMGHPEWAGDPRDFSDDIQDQVAWWTYQNQGAGPWSGSGCN